MHGETSGISSLTTLASEKKNNSFDESSKVGQNLNRILNQLNDLGLDQIADFKTYLKYLGVELLESHSQKVEVDNHYDRTNEFSIKSSSG